MSVINLNSGLWIPASHFFERGLATIPERQQLVAALWLCVVFGVAHLVIRHTKFGLKVPVLFENDIRDGKARARLYSFRSRDTLCKGYKTFPDQLFGVTTTDGVKLVLPLRLVDELRSHPALSFKASIDNDTQARYTLFAGAPDHLVETIKGRLNPSISHYVPVLHTLFREKIPNIFHQHDDWTSVKIYPLLLQLISTSSTRVFHSKAASDSVEWLEVVMTYLQTVSNYAQALKVWPPFLRPVVSWFLPHGAIIAKTRREVREAVRKSLETKDSLDGNLEDPPSMLDHMSQGKNAAKRHDLDEQAAYQLILVAVGSLTTLATTTQCVYDLATHTELIPILRDEVAEVFQKGNRILTKGHLDAMVKLDSFIKESQRFSSPDLTTFQRAAIQSLTLSDGTYIPKGTRMEIPTCAINVDEVLMENAKEFDGLRFYRKRQQAGEENKHQFVRVSKTDLAWGFGKHACPGRFLAHIQAKLVLAELLLRYDIVNLPGASRNRSQEFETLVEPDPEGKVMLKSIPHPSY